MKNLSWFFFLFLILIELSLITVTIFCNFENHVETSETYFLDINQSWADTLVKKMSLKEKIGQLFFLDLIDSRSENKEFYDSVIQVNEIGGVKFRQTEMLNQLILTNYLQAKSKYPLLIGSEGSIINKEDFNFPVGSIINSVEDEEFKNLYLENFSRVLHYADVGIEFSNSIERIDSLISNNGFSANDSIITSQSGIFRKKLYNKKVISCLNFNDELFKLKDSVLTDSLKAKKNRFNIDKFFAIQISQNLSDFISSNPQHYSLSKFVNKNYGYKGLIFTGINDNISEKKIFSLFNSGIEIFVVNGQIGKAIAVFKSLVSNGLIKEAELNKRVKRVLMAKSWVGLQKYELRSAENSMSEIMAHQRRLLSWKMYESSVCLLKNQYNFLPISNLTNKSHIFYLGGNKPVFFEEYLNNFMDISSSQYKGAGFNASEFKPYRNIIFVLDGDDNEFFKDSVLTGSLKKLTKQKNLVVVNFGNIRANQKFVFARALLFGYDKTPLSQVIAAQVIAGSIEPKGKISPACFNFKDSKVSYRKTDRFRYTIPEAAGFNSVNLEEIEDLIQSAIDRHATPGCQIFAARDGKVFYNKSFGYHSYDKNQIVKNSDVYDIASITKVAATTLLSMKLYEEGIIRLNDSLKYYIEDTLNCTIKNHQLKDFFLHQSGLQADMPILKYIRYRNKSTKRFDKYYSEIEDTAYSVKVADKYFLRKDYVDSIVSSLYELEWDSTKSYNYSDINFNIIYDVISRKINESYREYLDKNFYNPLQLRTMGFLPLERINKSRILPTQDDKFWRRQVLLGYPHDESAALFGGISGNAGLFSNANDLAILFQMFLNGGTYGDKKILKKETIEFFTSPQQDSPRGLGFARSKSGQFGHTGFTGCVVWANPENRMIFVFLSNSIHPSPMNKRLRNMEIREKVYDLIMKAYEPGSEILKIKE